VFLGPVDYVSHQVERARQMYAQHAETVEAIRELALKINPERRTGYQGNSVSTRQEKPARTVDSKTVPRP
jgi:hypothetical protein